MNANDPTATSCCVCCKEIPLDAAFTPEGAEYVEHFCGLECYQRHCCKVSDEAAFCLIQRPYISKTLLTRRISPRGSP
ncbi:DUF3330 domain-containing protein [Escherichia coli]|uniref:DUF3330 domain-containing protein n=1 Tax=Escherichia coli TaxID=562 RepID=UPI00201FC54E|nr:DUF3330 domain-containing protein [Escherichia coli]